MLNKSHSSNLWAYIHMYLAYTILLKWVRQDFGAEPCCNNMIFNMNFGQKSIHSHYHTVHTVRDVIRCSWPCIFIYFFFCIEHKNRNSVCALPVEYDVGRKWQFAKDNHRKITKIASFNVTYSKIADTAAIILIYKWEDPFQCHIWNLSFFK